MNPIERIFTSVIQSVLRLVVELVKGLFGFNATQSTKSEERPFDEDESSNPPPYETTDE